MRTCARATLASLEQFTVSPGAAPEMAALVLEASRARRLLRAADEIRKDVLDGSEPIEFQLEAASRRIFDIVADNRGDNCRSLGDLWHPTLDTVEAQKRGELTGIQTGYIDLDAKFRMDSTSLTILAARPSIGKTAFGLNVAINIAESGQGRVLFFSMEMGAEQLVRRVMCRVKNLDSSKLQNPQFLSDWDLQKLRDMEREVRDKLPIEIDDTPGVSIAALASRARRFALRHRDLAVILVDYLGLMDTPNNRQGNRNLELGDISRGLKKLAMELRVPIIALQQLNRNIEHRGGKDKGARPRLSDLRESGRIEEDADNVLFLHRERVQSNGPAEPRQGYTPQASVPTEVIVAKQRNGPIFTANLHFVTATGTFRNAA